MGRVQPKSDFWLYIPREFPGNSLIVFTLKNHQYFGSLSTRESAIEMKKWYIHNPQWRTDKKWPQGIYSLPLLYIPQLTLVLEYCDVTFEH